MSYQNNQKGFSLIECVIAIALLATIAGSMMSLESSVIKILQISSDKTKAALELNSIMAQYEYVLNAKGQRLLPKSDTPTQWQSTLNKKFKNSIAITYPKIQLSQFLLSALKIYYYGSTIISPEGIKLKYAAIADALDTKIAVVSAKPAFNTAISVEWITGKETKNLSEKFLLMNNEAIADLTIP